MNYWWVNHNKRFKDELKNRFIWSPKQNRNGTLNQTYVNLTKVLLGDIVFSYARARINAIGVAEKECENCDRPQESGEKADDRDENGWLVRIDWVLLEKPFRPKDYIDQINLLLPRKYSPIRDNGNGNQGVYLTSINRKLGQLLLSIAETNDPHRAKVLDVNDIDSIESEENLITEKLRLNRVRVLQGEFRSRLLTIEKCCRLTGVAEKEFLIASHIKPWRDSSDKEKLDGNNGLLLSPHVDKLFDNGWISFTDTGEIICATERIKNLMQCWGLDTNKNVGKFNAKQTRYLKYHRQFRLKKQ